MRLYPLARLTIALVVALTLAACGRPAAPQPTATLAAARPPEERPPATAVPAPPSPAPAATAPAEPPTSTATLWPAAPAAILASAAGQVVLTLAAGGGAGQVGLEQSGYGPLVGPPSFRIGADGSIRLLDALNRRVLFYTPAGQLARSLAAPEALSPTDFIVNNDGEVFVYDRGSWRDDGQGYTGQQVLRYGPDGALREALPVSDAISGDGLMLTADQHLVLALGNDLAYLITHDGAAVPPHLQPATRQRGAATPRSPVLFRVAPDDGGLRLDLDTAYSGRSVNNDWRQLAAPADQARFFNVDRAMNLYLTGPLDAVSTIDVRRLAPDGGLAGGARIDVSACAYTTWRTFYVDQEGAAWTLCASPAGVTVSRYDLLDPAGQPLPAASAEAADVPWRPGAVQNVAA